jgi:hypothetical protein
MKGPNKIKNMKKSLDKKVNITTISSLQIQAGGKWQ